MDPPPSVRRTHHQWATTLTDNDLRAADDVIIDPTPADIATTKGHGCYLHIGYNIGDLLAELAELYGEDGAI